MFTTAVQGTAVLVGRELLYDSIANKHFVVPFALVDFLPQDVHGGLDRYEQ